MSPSTIPTDVWELVALYCATHDIMHVMATINREFYELFDAKNDTFWMNLLKRDFHGITGSNPYKLYKEAMYEFYPFNPGVNTEPSATHEKRKVIFVNRDPECELPSRLLDWIQVRIPFND
jgi:hypothetical protein